MSRADKAARTTLTDAQIVGELGWTMQIIYDITGLVPTSWRPPYGNVDSRVRAIAKHVFGLRTILWNNDSLDWCLQDDGSSACAGSGPMTDADLIGRLTGFFDGSKRPGLLLLEVRTWLDPRLILISCRSTRCTSAALQRFCRSMRALREMAGTSLVSHRRSAAAQLNFHR